MIVRLESREVVGYTTKLPANLFIIGAPKCGTTALSHYLAQHPQVFMSETAGIKESAFFSTDLCVTHMPIVRDVAGYRHLFDGAGSEHRYRGEASAEYLFSKVAVPRLLTSCVEPRIIVMLRNPVDLVQSLHNEFTKISDETMSFERAWRLQAARLAGEQLPRPLVKSKKCCKFCGLVPVIYHPAFA